MDEYQIKIKEIICDDNLRNIIFNNANNSPTYLDTSNFYLKYISNAFIFIYMFLYKSFIKALSKEKVNLTRYSNSFIRIYEILNKCYRIKDFSYDIAEDFLINLEIDYKLQNEFLNFLGYERLFDFRDGILNKVVYLLKQSRISSRFSPNFSFDEFCSFFEMIPLFKKIKLEMNDFIDKQNVKLKTISVLLEEQNKRIELEYCLLYGKRSCLFLEEIIFNDKISFDEDESKKQILTGKYVYFQTLKRHYITFINEDNSLENNFITKYIDESITKSVVKYSHAIEDVLVSLHIYDFRLNNRNFYFFDDNMFFNNKYIKTLALVISDTLTNETKQELRNYYYDEYKDLFEKVTIKSYYNENLVRWDELIIFLLLEEGVHKILKLVVNNSLYPSFISNFILRFGERAKERFENPNSFLNKDSLIQNDRSKLDLRIKEIITLATELLSFNQVTFKDNYSVTSIVDIIENVEYLRKNNNQPNHQKIINLINKVVEVNIFMSSFYYGLIAYLDEKYNSEMTNKEIFKDYKVFLESNKKYLNAFTKKSKREKQNLIKNVKTLGYVNKLGLFEHLIENLQTTFASLKVLNDTVVKSDATVNERIYQATGKRELFNNSYMNECYNDIKHALETLKKEKMYSERIMTPLYNAVLKYFEYILDGNLGRNAKIEEAIYPIVASCVHSVVSGDGYRYSYVNVNTGYDSNKEKIKVISDVELSYDEFYYCVPNVNRVTYTNTHGEERRIWINPILIPYNSYPNKNKIVFSQLEDEEDYNEVSKLLYQTDERIYGSLFGSLENAQKVLPYLFNKKVNTQKAIFHKDFIYVLKIEEADKKMRIVAIATCYKEIPRWDEQYIRDAFNSAGVTVPPTIKDAFEYINDTFRESNSSSQYVICDLCVHPKYRNQTYGKIMLKNLIQEASRKAKDLIITVYADNIIAYNLYKTMGFDEYYQMYDNRGEADTLEKYIKLIKFHN